MTVKTYDGKCADLAAIFLGDEPHLHTDRRIHELALAIQQVIEDYIAEEQGDNYEPPDPPGWEGGFAPNH